MRTIQKKAAKAASGCLLLLLLYGCASNADAVQILDRDTSDRSQETVSQNGEELPRQTDTIVVYVCGEVKHPGVYELEAGSRIYQAIEKAGGLTAKAAKNTLNLADHLSDKTASSQTQKRGCACQYQYGRERSADDPAGYRRIESGGNSGVPRRSGDFCEHRRHPECKRNREWSL